MLPTPNRYWRLFNDPRLAPPDPGLSPITRGPRASRCDNQGIFRSQPTSPNADWDDPSHCPLHPSTGPSVDAPTSAYPSADGVAGITPVKAVPRRTPPRFVTPPPGRSHDQEPERLGESTAEPLPRYYASPARAGCYKPSSISSFDQFAKEFELNFIASSYPRPTTASLLSHMQGSDEPLAQFVSRFSVEIRRMPDTHPTLAIQAFLMGLRPS
ncbi:hypothetical protein B296_00028312 [Ensete ventricosum]|uniref:Retrotransposon gag domain-containing protein n=1 Tax=Ensete ventricosum TaxID=4639 RepID=A0A426Y7G3_ENSVE|nr:hypothetical protein B296_00028312 [Ensete ventricosum]